MRYRQKNLPQSPDLRGTFTGGVGEIKTDHTTAKTAIAFLSSMRYSLKL